jgi:hypothetical protein
MQRHRGIIIPNVHVSSMLQKLLDNLRVSMEAGLDKRRLSFAFTSAPTLKSKRASGRSFSQTASMWLGRRPVPTEGSVISHPLLSRPPALFRRKPRISRVPGSDVAMSSGLLRGCTQAKSFKVLFVQRRKQWIMFRYARLTCRYLDSERKERELPSRVRNQSLGGPAPAGFDGPAPSQLGNIL